VKIKGFRPFERPVTVSGKTDPGFGSFCSVVKNPVNINKKTKTENNHIIFIRKQAFAVGKKNTTPALNKTMPVVENESDYRQVLGLAAIKFIFARTEPSHPT